MEPDYVFSTVIQETGATFYNRSGSTKVWELEEAMATLYGLHGEEVCDIATSGMNAITLLLMTLVNLRTAAKVVIIHDLELYSDVPRFLEFLVKRTQGRVKLCPTDCSTKTTLVSAVRTEAQNPYTIVIVYSEICSNPSGQMLAIEGIPGLKSIEKPASTEIFTVVDNTWVSAIGCNPFDFGVDFVVESLTKYVGGCHVICGAVLGSHPIMAQVRNLHATLGNHVSPNTAEIILQYLPTLKTRITQASSVAVDLVHRLEAADRVVVHPASEKHPSCARASHFLAVQPAVLVVESVGPLSKRELERRCLCFSDVLEYKTSYGGAKSRIDPWSKSIQDKNPKGKRRFVRVAIGTGEDNITALTDAILAITI